jgi:hypothetical protein
MAYPPQVANLQDALAALPAIHSVSSTVQSISGLPAEDLRFPDFGRLPHGALRRTNGGLDQEALIQFEFFVQPTSQGWRTLEFIAWFVRDQGRGGRQIQLRPYALPPQVGDSIQLGHTLRWHIDLFCPNSGADLSPELAQIQEIAAALNTAVDVYGALLRVDT